MSSRCCGFVLDKDKGTGCIERSSISSLAYDKVDIDFFLRSDRFLLDSACEPQSNIAVKGISHPDHPLVEIWKSWR